MKIKFLLYSENMTELLVKKVLNILSRLKSTRTVSLLALGKHNGEKNLNLLIRELEKT